MPRYDDEVADVPIVMRAVAGAVRASATSEHDAGGELTSPLRHIDPVAVSVAAKAETRNREVHLPPVSVYRWWARRTEAVNGAVIDAVTKESGAMSPLLVSDPFAGGGVIALSAVLRGHRVYVQDLNPWAAAGLATMLGLPPASEIKAAGKRLEVLAADLLRSAYSTKLADGQDGMVSHTFRVATSACSNCMKVNRHFPHAMVSLLARKERGRPEAFLACPTGDLFKGNRSSTSKCPECNTQTDPAASYTERRTITCPCGHSEQLEDRAKSGTWKWEVVLVERIAGRQRELALPTAAELAAADGAHWAPTRDLGTIPPGYETTVLRRHGFKRWADLYPRRQRAVVEQLLTLSASASVSDCAEVVAAVRSAIVGSCEMAGYLSRWDRWYLKSYESMAGHRFNFTTLAVEPNVWGTKSAGRGTVSRRIEQLIKAAAWLETHVGRGLVVEGPVSSEARRTPMPRNVDVRVAEGSSERNVLPSRCVDLVLTDPPYHDDVQYSELSLPLRAWADLHMDELPSEAVVNESTGKNSQDGEYRDLLTRIFTEAARTLKGDGHLIFSYANRAPEAWVELFSALQAAGLRAAGFTIVHSENETDQAKRNVRACALDLIMDLLPAGTEPVDQWSPQTWGTTPEETFLKIVGRQFLQIGTLGGDWADTFTASLRKSRFLR